MIHIRRAERHAPATGPAARDLALTSPSSVSNVGQGVPCQPFASSTEGTPAGHFASVTMTRDLAAGRCHQEERDRDASDARTYGGVEGRCDHAARNKTLSSTPPGEHRDKQRERLGCEEKPRHEVARHTRTDSDRLSRIPRRATPAASIL